jgi:hypothetical protein
MTPGGNSHLQEEMEVGTENGKYLGKLKDCLGGAIGVAQW